MTEAEPVLVSDENRYRLLVEAVTDYAIYMLDPDGVVVSWNPGAERFKGYTAQEIVGRHFSRFYTEEDRADGLPAKVLATAVREGRVESEGWRVRKDGARFWAHVVVDPIHDPAGRLLGFAKITRDLSERRAAELELKTSEERFRRLVQGVVDYAIYMLDPDGRVTNWNLGAQRIKGYLPEEIVGQHFSNFYTEEDRADGAPARGLAIARAEGRFEKEGWRVRKDGTRFWANVVIDAIRDETGELIGFAKVTRDMTEKRAAQLALEKAREAFFQSQKMEAIGQLTGGVAHDFNNLLMAILGSLELVRKRVGDDPRLAPLLDNAIQGALRGASLTKRMLAFARRQELSPQPVDVADLLRGMADLIARSLGPDMNVETRFPLSLPPALVDPNQLELAILNLVVNARDAMPDGGTIVISGGASTQPADNELNLRPGDYVYLAVTDGGAGMDEATLARAAEPFFTTKGVGKGTGLGLSMVHGMADQSGGALRLRSRVGAGTTAEIYLPATTVDRLRQTPGAEPVRTPPPGPDGRLVVLAVDDDELVLVNTVAMLDDLGFITLAGNSGPEALAILRRDRRVDVVITDHAMPKMTGSQLAEAIRAEWPGLPIIIATGYAELPPGLAEYLPRLSKPYTQGELATVIARTVGFRAAEAGSALT